MYVFLLHCLHLSLISNSFVYSCYIQFIAERLLAINENGNFTNPPPSDPEKQEDELFQRARLVNCGFFMKLILGDYVGAILGLVRDGNTWRLDPLAVCSLYLR